MSSKRLDLTIIVVNYNGQGWIQTTLKTLKTYYLSRTSRSISVMVVDNASSDNSLSYLQQLSWIELIKLNSNRGFAVGNNVALQKVLDRGISKYTMLLNSDVEFDQRSNLDLLLDFLDQNTNVGVITPQLILSDGSLDMASHRGEPTPWAAASYFLGLEKMFPNSKFFARYHQTYQDLSQPHSIDACSGAAMIVRTNLLKKVGLLDERFFMYAEDLDWCRRFREAGSTIEYFPAVTVIHHKNKSGVAAPQTSTAKAAKSHFYDTMLQYFDKHYKLEYPSFIRHLVKWIITIKKGVS